MEKRSRRRIRDLVARPASMGLSENEIGCARISMMARNTHVPFKGRIQKRKTYHLQIITFRLQRAAGSCTAARTRVSLFDHLVGKLLKLPREVEAECLGRLEIDDQLILRSLLHRQVGWFDTLKNFVDVGSGAPSQIDVIRRVAHEPPPPHFP